MIKIQISYENKKERDLVIAALSSKQKIDKISKIYEGSKYNKIYLTIK